MLKIDNTKRSTAQSCLRKFYWSFIQDYQSLYGSTALRYGSAFHAGMEGYYSYIAEHGWSKDGGAIEKAISYMKKSWDEESQDRQFYDDHRTLQNCAQSLIQYIDHFANDEGLLKILSTEKIFKIPMVLNEKELKMFPGIEPYYFTGKLDLEVKLNDIVWLMEFKTTAASLGQAEKRLYRSPQLLGYIYAGRNGALEVPPEGSLTMIHRLYAYKSKKTELYGTPKIEFSRAPQMFQPMDLTNWRDSLTSTVWQIQNCDRSGQWPMCLDSCYTFGQCSYVNLCEQNRPLGEEIIDGQFYVGKHWEVTELNGRDK